MRSMVKNGIAVLEECLAVENGRSGGRVQIATYDCLTALFLFPFDLALGIKLCVLAVFVLLVTPLLLSKRQRVAFLGHLCFERLLGCEVLCVIRVLLARCTRDVSVRVGGRPTWACFRRSSASALRLAASASRFCLSSVAASSRTRRISSILSSITFFRAWSRRKSKRGLSWISWCTQYPRTLSAGAGMSLIRNRRGRDTDR
jgi:hypothetical protein